MIVLGFAPVALVLQFYRVLRNRTVIQWDLFGNTTIIGTRPMTVLTIAGVGAAIAVLAVLIGAWQNKAMSAMGLRRAYLALNLAQIGAIALTCCMIVSDALGLQLKIKPTIPPVMAVLVFAAGVLLWRLDAQKTGALRWLALVLLAGGVGLLAFSAIAMKAVVGYYASAFAVLAMVAVALPERAR
jgi:hypothetical protein